MSARSWWACSTPLADGPPGGRLDQDPFANIFPALALRVEAGILGSMPAPAGPTVARQWGAAQDTTDRMHDRLPPRLCVPVTL